MVTFPCGGTFPLAHRQVVEQVVSTSLRSSGRHLSLCENPLQTIHREPAHILYGIFSCHDDIHAREAAHRTYIHHIILSLAVPEPRSHEMLQTVHGRRSYCRFLVGFSDTQIESGEPSINARYVNTWLQAGMVDGETLYDFHSVFIFCSAKVRN